jgi:WD40 repeat protein
MAMTATPDLSHLWTVSADHLLCHYTVSPLPSPAHLPRTSSSLDNGADASASVNKWSTKQIGNASIALSADQRVLAVGGWDGRIRLFSSRTGKPLGILGYHRETVHCVAFPPAAAAGIDVQARERGRASRAGVEHKGQVVEDEGESRDKGAMGKESEDSVGEVEEVEAEEGRSADAETETVEIGVGDSDDDEESEEGGTPPVERWFASGGKDRRIAIWALKSFTPSLR